MDIARCIQSQGKSVDLLFSADSVITLDDIGDVYKVPSNVRLNFNAYVIPTPAWILAPFPTGKPNARQSDNSLNGILNIGLAYNLPGAVAHRNAFYHLAGGDIKDGVSQFPQLLLNLTLAVLRGATNEEAIHAALGPLQVLATNASLAITVETTGLRQILTP